MSRDFIEVDADALYYSLNHFLIPQHYAQDLESILLPKGIILDRVEALAKRIITDFLQTAQHPEKGLVMICVLKGGHQYFADLLNAIKRCNANTLQRSIPISLEFFRIKSYHNDASTGDVRVELTGNETWDDVAQRFQGKHLLIVEDIIDTGRTMKAFLAKLKDMQVASVKVTSLLVKRTPLSNGYIPDYVGFSIPDRFVVGYCLDYNEHFRDLDHICVINENGKQKYAE
jgi:hypoxanthine phosphoribosyltransferase